MLHETLGPAFANLNNQRTQYETVLEQIGDTAGLSLLDVGCGYGDLCHYLPDGTDYFGIDVDQQAIAKAHELHPDRRFLCSDVIVPADVIVAVGVLQAHNNPFTPEALLQQMWDNAGKQVAVTCWQGGGRIEVATVVGWWPVTPDVVAVEGFDFWMLTRRK